MAELGKGCGSTSWAMSLINICAWLPGLFPERTQEEVWGQNPDEGWAAGSLAPNGTGRRTDGGYVVSGSWPWSSGCLHAQWGAVGTLVTDDTGEVEDLGLTLIPMEELRIEDTWFVAGMRGTGSNTLVADEVVVPEHRFLSYPRAFQGEIGSEHTDEALYRSAFVPVTILILVGPQLGLASAAPELVLEQAPRRRITHTHFEQQSASTGFQMQLAEAASGSIAHTCTRSEPRTTSTGRPQRASCSTSSPGPECAWTARWPRGSVRTPSTCSSRHMAPRALQTRIRCSGSGGTYTWRAATRSRVGP
jgi:alkylation response protein AidB-like acyl-CoA dehydrogenase